jgi:hypothetical protein
VFPGPGDTPEFFAGADGQTLTALAAAHVPAPIGPRLVRNVEQLFAGQRISHGRRLVELREGRGFLRHPAEPYPHGETTAWVLLGLVHARTQPAFREPAVRARLARDTARTWSALRGFFDPACGAWHWRRDQAARDPYGRPQLDNEHYATTYTAVLAAWAMVEARRNGVRLERSRPILRATVDWLVRRFDPGASGWSAHYSPAASVRTDPSDGLTMQVYAVLQLVERWAPDALQRLPEPLTQAMHERLRDLAEHAPPLRSEHRWVVDVIGDDRRPRRVRDARTFYSLPWTYAAARLHHDDHATNERERIETRRALTALLDRTEERARTAHAREHLLELDELCAALAPRRR